jgi:protoheme IX farnesyltransferase
MAALAFYVFVYTGWLKRTTVHNIVIGGAAGAMPPLIGWAAVTGEISALPLLLFAIIFVWTPPHFWALSLLIRDDYARAGVPMLPVVQGEAATRKQILLYSVALVILSAVASLVGLLGPVYLVAALLLGGLFIWYAIALYKEHTRPAARRLFLYSLSYLALLFGAMVLDRRIPLP